LGQGTLNIGTISGGRAPNVVPDRAQAEIMFRLVSDAGPIREAVESAVAGRAEAREAMSVPAVRLHGLDDLPTTVVAFTTDIPPSPEPGVRRSSSDRGASTWRTRSTRRSPSGSSSRLSKSTRGW